MQNSLRSLCLVGAILSVNLATQAEEDFLPVDEIVAIRDGGAASLATLDAMEKSWHPGYATMLIELLRSTRDYETGNQITRILVEKTDKRVGSITDFYQPVWAMPYKPHPEYAAFKARIYEPIDQRFAEYFDGAPEATIRLDEIRWGGVKRDGIPPLNRPKMLKAGEAKYLADTDVVFGIDINGDARAYPKRILAWHEMFKDVVGGVSVNGVYCTLCGSMIIYETDLGGTHYELGTSGFLYRSNKLMYDHATKSMWNTLTGEPVVGPLVGKGIRLKRGTVVTTTWGEWKSRHPDTTVLSLKTGHRRDYGEGVAYANYFGTDELMFDVPDALKDKRLANKAEILALLSRGEKREPIAISADYLADNPIEMLRVGTEEVVILTDRSGANRVYEAGKVKFKSWDGESVLTDSNDGEWTVSEEGITSPDGTVQKRFPSHRAFWFGWHSAYPDTQLIK